MRLIGLCYQSEHAALFFATFELCHHIREAGHEAELIDLRAGEALPQLLDRLRHDPPDGVFALQGVGSRLATATGNLWTETKVPFVGLHYDNPCYNVFNHHSGSPYVANLYAFQSFTALRRRYLAPATPWQREDSFAFGIYPLPPAALPFNDRPIRLLFMKSGETLESCRAAIDGLTPRLRDAVWDALPLLERDPNIPAADMVQAIFAQFGETREAHFDLFWGVTHTVDLYLRRKKAIAMVEWLKQQDGAVIVGNGWDFISRDGARAEFRSSLSAAEAYPLYEQSRFVCNVTPQGPDIVHERPVFGLFNGCCAVTDRNRWWQDKFGGSAQISLFDPYENLSEQILPFVDRPDAAEAAAESRALALAAFVSDDKIHKLTAMIAAVRLAGAAAQVPLVPVAS